MGRVFRLRRLFESSDIHFSYPPLIASRLVDSRFSLRPFAQDDEAEWQELQKRNREWLAPWNASDPESNVPLSFAEWVRVLDEEGRQGSSVVLAMVENGRIVGEVSLGAIAYGSVRSAIVGYWVDRDHAGQGFTPLAVSLVADWAFYAQQGPHLHRLEVALLPVNSNSRRVVEKVGFTKEGIRRRYMHVAGQWRDHETWALLADDVPEGLEARLMSRKQQTPSVPAAR